MDQNLTLTPIFSGVPPTSEGGPPGTPAPYWKYTPQGGGPVQKFDQYGNPLAPGDQGHEQDSWKGKAPQSEPAPPTETPFPGEPVAPEIPEMPEVPVFEFFP
jgi:hypothetical protein